MSESTSDILIASAIKKALVRDKDRKEVKSLTRTKEIIDVLSRNYAANKSLIAKIISPIINLPDPTSYYKSLENCKEILAFLKRMKDNELDEHLQENHLANFESRAFYSVRRQTYCSELAKFTAGILPLSEVDEGIPEPRGSSTPRPDSEVSIRIIRKRNAEVEKLNSSAVDILNLQDRMKRNLSKLAIGKKLNFFKSYVRDTELFFLSEMISSLELNNSNNQKKDNGTPNKNGRQINVNKTEVNKDKTSHGSNQNNGKKRSYIDRINDPEQQKLCPTGCGVKHYKGSARFCKSFYDLPLEERCETAKKKKLCGKCLCGCFKYGHKGPSECTLEITCKKCGSKNHNTLLCRKTPELQAFATETSETKTEEENLDAYYAELGMEKDPEEEQSINFIQDDDDLNEIIEVEENENIENHYTETTELEAIEEEISNNYVEVIDEQLEENNSYNETECNLIEISTAENEDSEFQFFLNQTFSDDMSAVDHSNYFLHHQAKLASEIFQVKWSKLIPVTISRIKSKMKENVNAAKFLINKCREIGITKNGIQDIKYSTEKAGNIPDDELVKVANSLVLEFIQGLKLQPQKLQSLGQCLDLHATASKNWTQEEWQEITANKADYQDRFGKPVIEDEIDCVPYNAKDPSQVIEINKTDITATHFIPIKEWQQNTELEPPTPKDETIIFDVEKADGTRGQIEVKYTDLGVKLEDCRLENMPKLEPRSHPPPNENTKNYIHLNSKSKGVFHIVYQRLIKQALELHSKYGMTVKGMYLPVLVKIKDIIKKPDDIEIIRFKKEKSMYAKLILCIDSGSETALLDESVARSFVFDSDTASPVNVKINTVVGSSSEKLERQVLLFRGTDGIHYPSCALQIAKIGKDKMQKVEGVEKLCELFKFDFRTNQHFIKNAGEQNRRCHALISMKELGSFFEVLEPERLNGISPCISPNTKIIKSVLSDQLIMAGQVGLSYAVAKYQTLFVHKSHLETLLTEITRDKVTVHSVGKSSNKVTKAQEISSNGTKPPPNETAWECHYVTENVSDDSYNWKWEHMSQIGCDSDTEMDVHKINVTTVEEMEFQQKLKQKDDGGVTEILATESIEGTNDLSSTNIEMLNKIRTKLCDEEMTESALIQKFQAMDTHNLMIERDNVMHFSPGPEPTSDEKGEIDEEVDCCSLQCSDVIKILQYENEVNLKILCDSCRLRECAACNLANSHMTMADKLRYLECWRSTKLVEKDGELRCQVDFLYQNDPKQIFKKENSNFEDAKKNIDNNIKKLKRKGTLDDLINDVNMKISLGTLTPVSDKEFEWIKEHLPFHFSKLHVVHNECSESTPRRIINNTNTSVENHATSLSAQQLCIKNPLQDDFSILAGFCLHPHPVSLDVSKAYLRILVPYETSCLRLFIWYKNPLEMSGLQIYRRTSGDFGDTPMSGGLTLTQRKLLAPACKSSITSAIAKTSNFADNYIDALLSKLGWSTTTSDLVETSKMINLPLKPGATCMATDPEVLKKASIDPKLPTSNLLGITWNLEKDEVTPNDYFSLKGKSMGATIGKKLKDMEESEILIGMITRELLSRMSMQPYDRLGRMISPIISTLKTFLSRSCEIIPNHNYKESVSNHDSGFAQLCRDYLCKLIKFKEIRPFPRSTVPSGHVLYGMCFPADGGKPGYSAYCYSLSEHSVIEPSIHHDWRVIRDPLGVLSVNENEMKILNDPGGINFFTDKKPEVYEKYKAVFGKSMQSNDVTKEILTQRESIRSEYETKHGIGPLDKEEITAILNDQNNSNDNLESHILAARSKTSKRSIPAHEILGRALATELGLSISKTLGRYSLYTLKHITLIFPGDSVCSAMLHSPNIEIKNTLLLGGVRKAEANLRIITEQLPNASIWLTWLPGEDNPSDLSSKVVLDPIPTINSSFYRTGPKQFKSKIKVKSFCYKSYTPVEKWKWLGLPEKLTKISENASKLKELLNTTASDPLQTEETKKFIQTKESEYVQCKLCILEELDDSCYKCLDCVNNNSPADDCSILLVTRSRVKNYLANEIASDKSKETASKESHKLKHMRNSLETSEIVATSSESTAQPKSKPLDAENYLDPRISAKEKVILEMNRLDKVESLMPEGYNYVLERPVIEKEVYLDLLNQVLNWNVTFSLFHNLIRGIICFKMINQENKMYINTFAETWRAIVLSSQAHFGCQVTKKTSTRKDSKMLVTDFRLNSEAHEYLFKTRTLPVISGNDPLAPKLIRHSHLTSSPYGTAHANQKATEANSMRGKFGSYVTNAKRLVREISYNCLTCNKYREKLTKIRMGDLSVRISTCPRPFQSISVDPQGHVDCKPWVGARTTIQCYPLMIKCLESGAIRVKLMFKNDTQHVIMALLQLESEFAVRIKHISVDFGSNMIINNINPKKNIGQHSKHLFDMLESSHTALPQAQMQNCAETGAKVFKSYIKKLFQLTKDGKIPAICADEWSYLFSFVCNQINNIPYILDCEGFMLCPNDLVHFSPMSTVGNFEASSHFKNIQQFLARAKDYYNILQEVMMQTTLEEWHRLQQKEHNKKNGLNVKIQEGSLVGWRNSDERFHSGVVVKLEGHKAFIKDKLGVEHTVFTGNLALLASLKYSDYKESLRERYQNK